MVEQEQLRARARRRQTEGDLEAARELYLEAVRAAEAEGVPPDPGLLVRVADIDHRQGRREEALEYYRRTCDAYAEQGLVTNAIAVCHKVERLYPEESWVHRELARLHLDIGLTAEGRESLFDYVDAVREEGRPDKAVEAMMNFLERCPDQEVCLRLLSQLQEEDRTDEAAEVLEQAWRERARAGASVDALERRALELDAEVDLELARAAAEPAAERDEAESGVEATVRKVRAETGERETSRASRFPPPESASEGANGDAPRRAAAGRRPGAETDRADGPEIERPEESTMEAPDETVAAETDERNGEADPDAGEAGTAGETVEATAEEDAAAGRATPEGPRPEEGGAAGRPAGGERLPEAEELGEKPELRRGLELVEEMLELEPDNVELRRRKVRYARRLGERELLVEAYLDLADVLARQGSRLAARHVYRRVRELAPEERRAREGLTDLDVSELEDLRKRSRRHAAAAASRETVSEEEREARRKLGRKLWTEFETSVRELPWLHAATQAYRSGGSDTPAPQEAFEMFAHYLMSRGRHREAVEVLTDVLDFVDEDDEVAPDLLYHLGVAYQELGNDERAADCFGWLREIDPEFSEALEALEG